MPIACISRSYMDMRGGAGARAGGGRKSSVEAVTNLASLMLPPTPTSVKDGGGGPGSERNNNQSEYKRYTEGKNSYSKKSIGVQISKC